jgi:hypothetical protein
LEECWSIHNDNKNKNTTNLFQKVAVLKLVKECNEAIFRLTSERPTVMAIQDIANRANRLGIEYDNSRSPSLPPSEEQQIRNYIRSMFIHLINNLQIQQQIQMQT